MYCKVRSQEPKAGFMNEWLILITGPKHSGKTPRELFGEGAEIFREAEARALHTRRGEAYKAFAGIIIAADDKTPQEIAGEIVKFL